jgi:hypothetical protein
LINLIANQEKIIMEELDIIGKYPTPLEKLDMIKINVSIYL